MQTQQTTRLAYRYRLYPTKAQATVLEETLAVCRNVYNSLVHERTVLYETAGRAPGYFAQKHEIATWKQRHVELWSVHAHVLQNVAKRVDLAFQAFFRRVKNGEAPSRKASVAGSKPGYPRLKGKGQYDSLTFPEYGNGAAIVQERLRLSKIGDINIRLHRPVEGDIRVLIKTCTVRRTKTGKWFACFSCEAEPEPMEPSGAVPPHYTSQTCSGCGDIVKKTLDERQHRCLGCGLVTDRDTNAAVNILAAVGRHSLAALAA